jgi:glycosyltransferase involved in cell wall biosynthesis
VRIALYGDGRSPHTERWANAVADRGHDVAIVWFAHELAGADLSGFRSAITHHAHKAASPIRPWEWPGAARQRRSLARETRADLAHGLSLVGYGWAAAEGSARPLVLTALGSDVFRLRRSGRGSIADQLAEVYDVWRTRGAVRAADVVLADSAPLAALVRGEFPATETRIVRFGVETSVVPSVAAREHWRERLCVGEDTFVILSSRLVRPHYNIDTIIRALPLIRDKVPGSVLVLKQLERFSDPEYKGLCLDLSESLGVREAIVEIGELDRAELLELHAASDVYVSVPTTDGTAVSVLEAMAAGVAVVASDAPGIDPAILRDGQTAILVPPGDANALAAAVARLGTNPAERQEMVRRARDVVRLQADFDREIDRAVLLYGELVSARARNVNFTPAPSESKHSNA